MSDEHRTEELDGDHVTIRIHRCRPPFCVQCGGDEVDDRPKLLVRAMTEAELARRNVTTWPPWMGEQT